MHSWRKGVKGVMTALFVFLLAGAGFSAQKEQVYVLVQFEMFPVIEGKLTQWKDDVEAEGKYIVYLSPGTWDSPETVRDFLKTQYDNGTYYPVAGALLVGDIPAALSPDPWISAPRPNDAYYMSLTGDWYDSDGDGVLDGVSKSPTPDIWIGRLKADTMTGDEAALLGDYFQKNHEYRTGALSLPLRCLVYNDIWWSPGFDEVSAAGAAYADLVLVDNSKDTNAGDYLDRLSKGYETVYVNSHGGPESHIFDKEELLPLVQELVDSCAPSTMVYSGEIREADPKAFFYWFDSCATGVFDQEDYLAGSYIFGTTYGLTVVCCTRETIGIGQPFCDISTLGGEDWGAIFMEHFKDAGVEEVTIIGDPTLCPVAGPPGFTIWVPENSEKEPLMVAKGGKVAIPVRGKVTSGKANSILGLYLSGGEFPDEGEKGPAFGVTPGYLELRGLNYPALACVPMEVDENAAPGLHELKIVAERCGLKEESTFWVEVVDCSGGPDFYVWYPFNSYGKPLAIARGETAEIPVSAEITSWGYDGALQVSVRESPGEWPAGISIDSKNYYNSVLLEGPFEEEPVTLGIRADFTAGLGVHELKLLGVSAYGKEKKFPLWVEVVPGGLDISVTPSPASVLPGAGSLFQKPEEVTLELSLAQDEGEAVVLDEPVGPEGLDISQDLAYCSPDIYSKLALGGNYGDYALIPYGLSADWDIASGTYEIPFTARLADYPGIERTFVLEVDVEHQFTMDIVPDESGALKVVLKNQALVGKSYKVELSCTSALGAKLAKSSVSLQPGSSSSEAEVLLQYSFPVGLYADPVQNGKKGPAAYDIEVTASTPGHPDWPDVTGVYTLVFDPSPLRRWLPEAGPPAWRRPAAPGRGILPAAYRVEPPMEWTPEKAPPRPGPDPDPRRHYGPLPGRR